MEDPIQDMFNKGYASSENTTSPNMEALKEAGKIRDKVLVLLYIFQGCPILRHANHTWAEYSEARMDHWMRPECLVLNKKLTLVTWHTEAN